LDTCKLALKNLDGSPHSQEAIKLTGKYLTLFSLGDKVLSDDVLNKLDGIFRKKFFSESSI